MGVVYRAFSSRLKRDVALKFIRSGRSGDPIEVDRFLNEARLAGKLDHPNVVPVFAVDDCEGLHYLVMKWVDGGSLQQHLGRLRLDGGKVEGLEAWLASEEAGGAPGRGRRRRKLPLNAEGLRRKRVQWVAQIARAVHYAHQHGILHRDLKPANILLDSDWNPYVADFGLARLMAAEELTTTGPEERRGTPLYMSPEQHTVASSLLTTATDIWSLGVILYQCVTGRLPFSGATREELVRAVREDEPQVPSHYGAVGRAGRGWRDLDAICLRCLEKDPTRRYASAENLAEDLECWLADEPVGARLATRRERVWRWCRRKPALAGLYGSLGVGLAAGLVAIGFGWLSSVREAQRRAFHYVGDMNLAHQELLGQNLAAATKTLSGWTNVGVSGERGFEWGMMERWREGWDRDVIYRAGSPVHALAVAPSGENVALAVEDGMRLVSLDGREMKRWLAPGLSGRVSIGFESGTANPVVASSRGLLRFRSDSERLELLSDEPCNYLSMSPSGKFALVANVRAQGGPATHGMNVWETSEWRKVVGTDAMDAVWVRWSTAEDVVWYRTRMGQWMQWSWRHEAPRVDVAAGELGYTGCASPDGTWVASCNWRGTIEVRSWNQSKPTMGRSLQLPGFAPRRVQMDFSGDSRWFAASGGGGNHRVLLYDLRSGALSGSVIGHTDAITGLQFLPDHRRFVSASRDGTVAIRSVDQRQGYPSRGFSNRLIRMDGLAPIFSEDGRWVVGTTFAEGGRGEESAVYDLGKDEVAATVRGRPIAISPDSKWLMTGTYQGKALVWDLEGDLMAPRHEFPTQAPDATAAPPTFCEDQLTPDGRVFLSLRGGSQGDGFQLRAIDARYGVSIGLFEGRAWWVAMSPKTELTAVQGVDRKIWLWEFRTNRRRNLGEYSTDAAAFSPDGRWLAMGTWDQRVILFDLREGGMRPMELRGHQGGVASVAFSADSRTLATGSDDRTFRLWHVGTQRVLVNQPMPMPVYWLRFSGDGRWLATGYYPPAGGEMGRYDLWEGVAMGDGKLGRRGKVEVEPESIWAHLKNRSQESPGGSPRGE